MPWKAQRDSRCPASKPWGVIKTTDGSVTACHATEEAAKAQVRALFASETKEGQGMDGNDQTVDPQEETLDKGMFGPTSFREFDEAHAAMEKMERVHELLSKFTIIVRNIIGDPEIENKSEAATQAATELVQRFAQVEGDEAEKGGLWDQIKALFIKAQTKTEDGVSYPASDFAYVPDPEKPSTWKLRMAEGRPGNITVAQLGRAAAAFSPGGFRGNKVQIPSGDVAKVKAKLRAAYRKLGVKAGDIPGSLKEVGPEFTLWKQADGTWRWLTIYSNKYRDRDRVPEILSEAAHKEFVQAVEAGDWPYPEIWLWHTKGTAWGKADWLYYDEQTGFALASGYVDNETVAKGLAELAVTEDLAVSHGMPSGEVQRDPDDRTIITRYRSREISVLPRKVAANLLTDFSIKEATTVITDEKKQFLIACGYTEAQIAALEKTLVGREKQALDSGLDFKDTTADASTDPVQEQAQDDQASDQGQETQADVSEAAAKDTAQDAASDPVQPDAVAGAADEAADAKSASVGATAGVDAQPEEPITRKEIFEAILQAQQPMDQAIRQLVQVVDRLQKQLEQVESGQVAKEKAVLETTPAASLVDMVRQARAVGDEQARLDGRVSLAKAGPKQPDQTPTYTGVTFIDQILSAGAKPAD